MWGVDRLQVVEFCSCRLVYREVVEDRSNYKKYYLLSFRNPAWGSSIKYVHSTGGCCLAKNVRICKVGGGGSALGVRIA